ncbi:hypothetical protein Hanom_Chr06g00523341 [Helianthus anomalus]
MLISPWRIPWLPVILFSKNIFLFISRYNFFFPRSCYDIKSIRFSASRKIRFNAPQRARGIKLVL